MYTENDLVRVAKRENNTKRAYLVVNRLQAKHVPVQPGRTIALFDRLAGLVQQAYGAEPLLLIGFAETATAIGARLAIRLNSYYMQTTRETEAGAAYIYFEESHSHATEQKLFRDDLEQMAGRVRRIVFVEDEVTTGNTIMKIVRIIREMYRGCFSFSVASLLNGMDGEALATYRLEGIAVHYVVKTDHASYPDRAASFAGDGCFHEQGTGHTGVSCLERELSGYVNARHLVKGSVYEAACERLWEQIHAHTGSEKKKIAVLGTEEFMYPAIDIAYRLEQKGNEVWCHSTTRSPIAVSREEEYPLHERYELVSFYDSSRRTYIYDLKKYDMAVVLTDAGRGSRKAEQTLLHALRQCGTTDVVLYRWCNP